MQTVEEKDAKIPSTADLSLPLTAQASVTSSNATTTNANQNIASDGREMSPQGRYVKLEDRLGSGAYKDVWRAFDTNEGKEVAWNVVKLNRIPPNERKRIKTEVKLLKDIEHKNVIKYFNSWVDREKEQIVFITEILSHGSLKDYLKKNPIIRWNAVKRWCRQILRGLEFLHANQIIHRDIKCDNIFINGTTGDLRIGDLGLSTRISEERGALLKGVFGAADGGDRIITAAAMTCLGTPEFMAPELYEENYNEKVDIYAFGMSLLEMITGLIPYHECTSAPQIYRKVLNGELPPELERVVLSNPRAAKFIQACLQLKDKRPTATELLADEFLLPNEAEDFAEVRVKLQKTASFDASAYEAAVTAELSGQHAAADTDGDDEEDEDDDENDEREDHENKNNHHSSSPRNKEIVPETGVVKAATEFSSAFVSSAEMTAASGGNDSDSGGKEVAVVVEGSLITPKGSSSSPLTSQKDADEPHIITDSGIRDDDSSSVAGTTAEHIAPKEASQSSPPRKGESLSATVKSRTSESCADSICTPLAEEAAPGRRRTPAAAVDSGSSVLRSSTTDETSGRIGFYRINESEQSESSSFNTAGTMNDSYQLLTEDKPTDTTSESRSSSSAQASPPHRNESTGYGNSPATVDLRSPVGSPSNHRRTTGGSRVRTRLRPTTHSPGQSVLAVARAAAAAARGGSGSGLLTISQGSITAAAGAANSTGELGTGTGSSYELGAVALGGAGGGVGSSTLVLLSSSSLVGEWDFSDSRANSLTSDPDTYLLTADQPPSYAAVVAAGTSLTSSSSEASPNSTSASTGTDTATTATTTAAAAPYALQRLETEQQLQTSGSSPRANIQSLSLLSLHIDPAQLDASMGSSGGDGQDSTSTVTVSVPGAIISAEVLSSVSVADITDHPSNPNSLIFHFRIPAHHGQGRGQGQGQDSSPIESAGSLSGPGSSSSGTEGGSSAVVADTKWELELEFEFDLVLDDAQALLEEMKECEDLASYPMDTKQIMELFFPIIQTARSLLARSTGESSSSSSSLPSSLAALLVRELSSRTDADHPSLRRLQKQQQQQGGLPIDERIDRIDRIDSSSSSSVTVTNDQQQQRSLQQQEGDVPFSYNGRNYTYTSYADAARSDGGDGGDPQQQQQQSQDYFYSTYTQDRNTDTPVAGEMYYAHDHQYHHSSSSSERLQRCGGEQIIGSSSNYELRTLTTGTATTTEEELRVEIMGGGGGGYYQQAAVPLVEVVVGGSGSSSYQQQQQQQTTTTSAAERDDDTTMVDNYLSESLDDEDDPEYIEMMSKYNEAVARVDKEYIQRMQSIATQREKAEEIYKKEYGSLITRKGDLDKQLEVMQDKFKERMDELSARRKLLEGNVQNDDDDDITTNVTDAIVATAAGTADAHIVSGCGTSTSESCELPVPVLQLSTDGEETTPIIPTATLFSVIVPDAAISAAVGVASTSSSNADSRDIGGSSSCLSSGDLVPPQVIDINSSASSASAGSACSGDFTVERQ